MQSEGFDFNIILFIISVEAWVFSIGMSLTFAMTLKFGPGKNYEGNFWFGSQPRPEPKNDLNDSKAQLNGLNDSKLDESKRD